MLPYIFQALLLFNPFVPHESPPLSISSEEYEKYSHRWAEMTCFDDAWYLFLKNSSGTEIHLIKWANGKELKILARLGPREGIQVLHTFAVNQKGQMAIKGLLSPKILSLTLDQPSPKFQTFASSPVWVFGNMIFWDEDHLIGTSPELHIECIGKTLPSQLSKLNDLLPDDTYHPSLHRQNLHKMLIAKNEKTLAFGYTLYDRVLFFDLETEKMKRFPIPGLFPQFQAAPDSYPKGGIRDPGYKDYIRGFYRLLSLSWFKGAFYGEFQQGYDEESWWVRLDPSKPGFARFNQEHDIKILAMCIDQLVCGSKNESEDGIVTWSIWQTSSLPSP